MSIVGVNALFVRTGVVGGTETYVVGLLRSIARRSRNEHEIVVYATRGLIDAYPDLAEEFRTQCLDRGDLTPARRVAVEHSWLAARSRRDGVDVLHHLGGTIPGLRTAPALLTLHDLQPLLHPERFSRTKARYLGHVIPRAARRARRVVAVSNFTRDQIVDELGIPAARVDVVRTGLDVDPTPAVSDIVERLDLRTRPYFLFPAITHSHKNHRTLLAAFRALGPTNAALVLTGGVAECEEEVRLAAASDPNVLRLGRIGPDDLDALYRRATALVFPSVYEGLGIPVLEAMARGCPVISSNAAGLPEAVGDAGVLLDPHDATSWTETMALVLSDDERRAALSADGHRHVASFDWSLSADAQLESWNRALAGVR